MNINSSLQPIHTDTEEAYRLPLDEKQMPASLAGQALRWAANTNALNPPNLGQSCISKTLGKPVRFVARLVYGLAVPLICALGGIFYHAAAVGVNAIKAKLTKDQDRKLYFKELAWGHAHALGCDAQVVGSFGLWAPSSDYGAFSVITFASNSRDIAAFVSCYFNEMDVRDSSLRDDSHLSHETYVYNELVERS